MKIRNAKHLPDGMIFCEINHPEFGWIPYNASADDPETVQIYGRIINGDAGPIAPVDQEQNEAELLAEWRERTTCSNLQARLALEDVNSLDLVEQAIQAAPKKTQIAWDRAQYFRRLSPTVLAMQVVLGWSDVQMDDLFKAAILIEA